MALSNMAVLNSYIQEATFETLTQMVDAFNQRSNNGLRLIAKPFDGDFDVISMFANIDSSVATVDLYGSNSSVGTTDLSRFSRNIPKVAGRIGPIGMSASELNWIGMDNARAVEALSRKYAELMLQKQLNNAIAAAIGAITSKGASGVYTTTSALDQADINASHALFGDASQKLVCSIMSGAAYHKLVAGNLVNTPTLYQAANVRVVDILGKVVIVTDAPALTSTMGSPAVASFKVLSLVEGGVTVKDTGMTRVVTVDTLGTEWSTTKQQVEWQYGIDVLGYDFDITKKSPTDAELAAAANWSLAVGSIKNSAGVVAFAHQA